LTPRYVSGRLVVRNLEGPMPMSTKTSEAQKRVTVVGTPASRRIEVGPVPALLKRRIENIIRWERESTSLDIALGRPTADVL